MDGDSNSIVNQKAILSKYASDNGFTNSVFFIDDGVSGVTFDRPNFNRMIAKVEAGNGPMRIAKTQKADKVLTTRAHYAKQKGKPLPDNPYSWNLSTIVAVLERINYWGHTVNFKCYSKSHKLKKRISTTKEQQAISTTH